MTAYEMAKNYYPRLWNKTRLEALLKANKITKEEYYNIIKDEEEK